MTFFFTALRLRCKAVLSGSFIVAGALLPAAILALGLIFNRPGGLSIQIGVWHDGSARMQRIEESLRAYGGTDWTLIVYTDADIMRNDVAARRLEMAYLLTDERILVYTSPMTVMDNVTNLLVAAAFLEQTAGAVGAQALLRYTDLAPEGLAVAVQARVDDYLADGPFMERVVVTHGLPAAAAATDAPFRRLFQGLTALATLVFALLCAKNFTRADEKALRFRVHRRGRGASYVLANVATTFVLAGGLMTATLVAGAVLYPGVWHVGALPVALWYAGAVSGLSVLAALTVRETLFPVLFSTAFLFTALLGGVVFDLREVLRAMGGLRFAFPSHYFMNDNPGALAGIAAASFLACVGVSHWQYRRQAS